MRKHVVLIGALLLAAPVFSQETDILSFRLNETRAAVLERLGKPAVIMPAGEYESWQYQIGVHDNHEFSHVLLFRISTGELISVTRNWEEERPVDEWFPAVETRVHYYPDDSHPEFGVRVRRMSGGRVLIAMGAPKAGQPTGQVLMIRESELPQFQPWLKLPPK
jgi:hypothetical protein